MYDCTTQPADETLISSTTCTETMTQGTRYKCYISADSTTFESCDTDGEFSAYALQCKDTVDGQSSCEDSTSDTFWYCFIQQGTTTYVGCVPITSLDYTKFYACESKPQNGKNPFLYCSELQYEDGNSADCYVGTGYHSEQVFGCVLYDN